MEKSKKTSLYLKERGVLKAAETEDLIFCWVRPTGRG
jgi:hypothetical protein